MMEAFLTELFLDSVLHIAVSTRRPKRVRVVVLCIEAVVLVQDLHEVNKTILGREQMEFDGRNIHTPLAGKSAWVFFWSATRLSKKHLSGAT